MIKFLKMRMVGFSEEERDAILSACIEGDIDLLKEKYAEHGSFKGISSEVGLNILMIACIQDREEIVTWLLTGKQGGPLSGINLNYKIPNDIRPPRLKTERRALEKNIADWLPSDLDVKTKERNVTLGATASQAFSLSIDLAMSLDALKKGANVMHVAARDSSIEIINCLLDAGLARLLRKRDSGGSCPLGIAINRRDGQVIYTLHEAQKSHMSDEDYQDLLDEIDLVSMSLSSYDEERDRLKERGNILREYFGAYKAGNIPSVESTAALQSIGKEKSVMSTVFRTVLNEAIKPLSFIFDALKEDSNQAEHKEMVESAVLENADVSEHHNQCDRRPGSP